MAISWHGGLHCNSFTGRWPPTAAPFPSVSLTTARILPLGSHDHCGLSVLHGLSLNGQSLVKDCHSPQQVPLRDNTIYDATMKPVQSIS